MEISKDLLSHFEDFIETVPAKRLQWGLIHCLFSYLKNGLKEGKEISFDNIICDLEKLLIFLNAIDSNCDQSDLIYSDME